MSDTVTTLEYKGFTIEVYQDLDFSNPREEWDNATKIVCFHRRYLLGDKPEQEYRRQSFNSWDELEAKLHEDHDILIIKPLYMYDHSGITISTSPFSCNWDSGQIGFVFITKQAVRENFMVKRIGKKIKERADKLLEGEVKTYDDYLRGNVYRFLIRKDGNDLGTDVDCGGQWYGLDELSDNSEMLTHAKSEIDALLKYREEKAKKDLNESTSDSSTSDSKRNRLIPA